MRTKPVKEREVVSSYFFLPAGSLISRGVNSGDVRLFNPVSEAMLSSLDIR